MKVAILGAGAYGCALGGVLLETGHEVEYYDPIKFNRPLEDVVSTADIIILAAPSHAVSELLSQLPQKTPLIIATKGLLSGKMFDGFDDVMVLSGPGFATQITAHQLTHLTITDERIKQLFDVNYFDFDYTNDILGVLLCGSLKNVYAILAGYLNLSKNSSDYQQVIDAIVTEMGIVLEANGAKSDTAELYCGRGDLEISCSPKSRNYSFGLSLKKDPNSQPNATIEGLSAIKQIKAGQLIVPSNATYLRKVLELV